MNIIGARLLRDIEIIEIYKHTRNFIDPFINYKHSNGMLSYGLEPFGYTIRLGTEFWFPPTTGTLDPKRETIGEVFSLTEPFELEPNQLVIGYSLEYIQMPPNVVAIGFGKSTYARMGVHVNITPIDSGWEGFLSISITNNGSNPVMIYPKEGIAQLLFYWCPENPTSVYDGNYQKLLKPQPAKIGG